MPNLANQWYLKVLRLRSFQKRPYNRGDDEISIDSAIEYHQLFVPIEGGTYDTRRYSSGSTILFTIRSPV